MIGSARASGDAQLPSRIHRPRQEVTAMSWGLENRLSRIIRPEDGRTVMLAVDHGYFLGPTTRPRVHPCERSCRSRRTPTRSCSRAACCAPSIDPAPATRPIVLRVSGANSVLDDDLSNETIITDIEECIRLNAAGHGALDLRRLAAPAPDDRQPRQAHRPGRALRHPGHRRDGRGQGHGARRALPRARDPHRRRDGRAHRQDVLRARTTSSASPATCPVPVVMAGGKKLPEREALADDVQRDRARRGRRGHGPQHLPVATRRSA